MLTYSLENIGSEKLYAYLYRQIKNDILNQKIKTGEKLPSKRSLAKHLSVSVITVETAYSQLIAEGYLYSIPKKGYFVSDLNKNISIHNAREPENPNTALTNPAFFADFASNTIHPDNFPFSTWIKLMHEIISKNPPENLLQASQAGGISVLREAIAVHLYEYRGMSVLPEQIIIGAGTEYIYHLIIQLLGRNHIFALENPGYSKISKIYKKNQVACCPISMDQDGISVVELEKSPANIVHISPSHHFPTGIVLPVSRRYELLSWASKADNRYIIEDDYDCEFRLTGKPIPALQSIDVMEKVIYINTFSKSLAPSFRISYMILPRHLLKRFFSELDFYSCTVSNLEQYTLAKFINLGYFEKHINRMRNYYHSKRNKLINLIKRSRLNQISVISEENSGLHFLLELETSWSDDELIQRMTERNIRISCLSQYFMENTPAKQIRQHVLIISYAGLKDDKMEEAIHRIEEAVL